MKPSKPKIAHGVGGVGTKEHGLSSVIAHISYCGAGNRGMECWNWIWFMDPKGFGIIETGWVYEL